MKILLFQSPVPKMSVVGIGRAFFWKKKVPELTRGERTNIREAL
jgi:hypothetical protein